MTKKRGTTAVPAKELAASTSRHMPKHSPIVVLLLVFGDLESATGVIRADEVFDRLTARGMWLVTRVPRGAETADTVALLYQSKVGFRAAARIAGIFDTTAADAGIIGLSQGNFLKKRLKFSTVKKWPESIRMAPLVERLSFVSNKKYWGHALRSSPRIIPFDDFETIVGRNLSSELCR